MRERLVLGLLCPGCKLVREAELVGPLELSTNSNIEVCFVPSFVSGKRVSTKTFFVPVFLFLSLQYKNKNQ